MGTVYKAEHTLIGKLAAVKILHPELSGNRDIVGRFFNEARATTSINHPGIVEVFDFGYMESGHAFLVMEFLDGMSLARRIRTRGKTSQGEAALLLRAVCSALAAAHAKGIVHRDLKPDNIYMVPDADSPIGERAKVLDFGIAKLTDIGLAGTATKTGAVMGTPTYMSPEQCKGTGVVDHRADLYSIGCIFYELVTGRPPFTNLGAGELIGAHLFVEPDKPTKHEPTLSAETETLIMSLLSKDPAKRPQTATELAQEFAALARLQGWQVTQSTTGPVGRISAATLATPAPSDTTVMSNEAAVAAAAEAQAADDELNDASATISSPSHSSLLTKLGTPAPFVGRKSGTAAAADAENPLRTQQPTTLSGAASQSIVQVPKRRGWMIGAIAVVVLGGGVGAMLSIKHNASGNSSTVDTTRGAAALSPNAPAARPTTTVIAPAPMPTTAAIATPAAVATPATATIATPPATAAVATPATATPVIAAQAPKTPSPTIAAVAAKHVKPHAIAPAAAPAPAIKHPPTISATPTPVAPAQPTQPAATPATPQPGKGSGKILIETDI
jgi:serine/threonine-protein kinase